MEDRKTGKTGRGNGSAKKDSPTSRGASPRMFRASTTKNRNTSAVFKLRQAPHLKREERERYIGRQGTDTMILRMEVEYIVGKAGRPEELKGL